MGAIADELLAAMSVGLGLPPGHLEQLFGTDRMSLVKLIHYPPTPAGEAGVNAHHDTGFLTLLLQHGVGGLQIQNQDGEWIDVPVDDGSVVVNLGEMLQAMTGNYFVATTHRVVATEAALLVGLLPRPRTDDAAGPAPVGRALRRRRRRERAPPRRRVHGPPRRAARRRCRHLVGRRPPPTGSSCGTTSPAAIPTWRPATTPTFPPPGPDLSGGRRSGRT